IEQLALLPNLFPSVTRLHLHLILNPHAVIGPKNANISAGIWRLWPALAHLKLELFFKPESVMGHLEALLTGVSYERISNMKEELDTLTSAAAPPLSLEALRALVAKYKT